MESSREIDTSRDEVESIASDNCYDMSLLLHALLDRAETAEQDAALAKQYEENTRRVIERVYRGKCACDFGNDGTGIPAEGTECMVHSRLRSQVQELEAERDALRVLEAKKP